VDATPPCVEGTTDCVGAVFQRCQGGQLVTVETCSRYCSSQVGCVDCLPNTGVTCVDNVIHACADDGSIGAMLETCSGGLQCENGVCADVCGAAASDRSYIGCDYFAVDLWNVEWIQSVPPVFGTCAGDQGKLANLNVCFQTGGPFGGTVSGLCDNNADCSRAPAGAACGLHDVCLLDGQHAPFAVVVANPSVTSKAEVTIAALTGETATVEVGPRQVQPLFPQMLGLPDQSLAWSSIEQKGYRVTSTRPSSPTSSTRSTTWACSRTTPRCSCPSAPTTRATTW
jgi:hypothetical protein